MNDVMKNVYWTWSLVLLAVWTAVFTAYAPGSGKMLRMRLVTLPLGLTEPLFVPAYWTSPTIFDLARRTGVCCSRLPWAAWSELYEHLT